MKKLITFLVMACVSIGAWASVSVTFLANSSNYTSNGKGFTYDHTAYQITSEVAGDLAVVTDFNALTDQNNSPMFSNDAAYFVFSGPLSTEDLANLSTLGSSCNYDVYFDFSNATFENGASISNLGNQYVDYVVLPNNTTTINASDFPVNVLEAIAVNTDTKQFLSYSSDKGAGTLEHVLNYDFRVGDTNNPIEDFTLVGTYTYNHDTPLYEKTMFSTDQLHKESVFGILANDYNKSGFSKATIKSLHLKDAHFPTYDKYTINTTVTVNAWSESDNAFKDFDVNLVMQTNALDLVNLYAETLTSIELPETNDTKVLPFRMFYNCKGLTSIDVPGNFETIEAFAFEHAENATSITLEEGVKTMGSDCFYCCYYLEEIKLPSTLTNVADYAFAYCLSLRDVYIPEGIETIGKGAFERTAITSVRLPQSLTLIDDNAFRQCLYLTSITIPENVTRIGSNAFSLCYSLRDVWVMGTTTIPECPYNAFDTYTQYNNGAVKDVTTYYDYWQEPDGNWTGQRVGQVFMGSYLTETNQTVTLKTADSEHSAITVEFNGYRGAAYLHYPDGYGDVYSLYSNRNSKYKGTYVTESDIDQKDLGSGWGGYTRSQLKDLLNNTWPDIYGYQKWPGMQADLLGYWSNINITPSHPNPDSDGALALGYGTNLDSTHNPNGVNTDGFKLFLLAFGNNEEPETLTKEYGDVWYTMCFPFELNNSQLENAFNKGYELCEFSGVELDESTKTITLNFTNVVNLGDDGTTTAYKPYMIHPNIGKMQPSKCNFVGIKVVPEDETYNNVNAQAVTKQGTITVNNETKYGEFTFIGKVTSDEVDKQPIPYGAYFLGRESVNDYPKYWRESRQTPTDMTNVNSGLWKQYSAVIQSNQVVEDAWFGGNKDSFIKSFDFNIGDFDPNEADAIQQIVNEAKENNVPVEYLNIVYDINGKQIQKGDANLENLPSGMYIVNGKKYLVK